MNIFVLADKEQEKEILSVALAEDTSVTFVQKIEDLDILRIMTHLSFF